MDEEKYPEFYRKTERVKGSNENIGKPFGVGIISEVEHHSYCSCLQIVALNFL